MLTVVKRMVAMVKQGPFQADLFTMQSIEKQVATIKKEMEQKKSTSTNEVSSATPQEIDLLQKINELESRVRALEDGKKKKRGWFA